MTRKAPLSGGRRIRLNARPCHPAIASKSFKPAKIYFLKPHCSAPVARRNNDAGGSLNRTGVVVSSPAEVRRSLNPSGDQPCPSALHFSRPPPLARWL